MTPKTEASVQTLTTLKTLEVEIQGVAPLMMHNRQLADPTNEYARAMKEISSRRKKTDADHQELKRLEFLGGIYCDEKGPFVPSEWIESMVRDGAKTYRQGKSAVAAIFTDSEGFHLAFRGPKKPEALFKKPEFVDSRIVVVQRARIMRTRPIFPVWSLNFTITINSETLQAQDVMRAISNAGAIVGLGDYRPKYGRFVVSSFKEVSE